MYFTAAVYIVSRSGKSAFVQFRIVFSFLNNFSENEAEKEQFLVSAT